MSNRITQMIRAFINPVTGNKEYWRPDRYDEAGGEGVLTSAADVTLVAARVGYEFVVKSIHMNIRPLGALSVAELYDGPSATGTRKWEGELLALAALGSIIERDNIKGMVITDGNNLVGTCSTIAPGVFAQVGGFWRKSA